MKVGLFVTCIVDQMWSDIGTSSVEVLRRAGCTVEFDERQTCCGQPAFNTGYRAEARRLAERFIELCEESQTEAIVSPSGSCTAMVHHYPALFPDDEQWRGRARVVAGRTFELSSFLVRVLKIEDLGARFAGRLTWHDACHGLRDLNVHDEPRRLIKHVREAEAAPTLAGSRWEDRQGRRCVCADSAAAQGLDRRAGLVAYRRKNISRAVARGASQIKILA